MRHQLFFIAFTAIWSFWIALVDWVDFHWEFEFASLAKFWIRLDTSVQAFTDKFAYIQPQSIASRIKTSTLCAFSLEERFEQFFTFNLINSYSLILYSHSDLILVIFLKLIYLNSCLYFYGASRLEFDGVRKKVKCNLLQPSSIKWEDWVAIL